jgi:hypothetical protein
VTATVHPNCREVGSPRRALNPDRQMALAYTAFGYFSLLIVLALIIPGR